jgi:hypothetical protein
MQHPYLTKQRLFRVIYWMAIAAAFTTFHITQSLQHGKLALPLKYDDIAYLAEGIEWLNALRHGGLAGFWNAPVAHAPISVYTAFLGFIGFGPHLWAPYAMNGVFVFGVLLGLDYLARSLPTYQRLLLPLTALTYPLLANLVMAFRPDIFCSIVTAYLLVLTIQTNWRKPGRYRILSLGIILGIALLSKPSISPITIILTISSIFISTLTSFGIFLAKTPGKSFKRFSNYTLQVLGLGILVACPYYLSGGFILTVNYITSVMFGPNKALWVRPMPLDYTMLYYLTGRGSMMGAWLGGNLLLAMIAFALVCYRRREPHSKQHFNQGIAAITVSTIAYLSVTIPSVKSPFLGLIVTALSLILSFKIMLYLLTNLNQYLARASQKTASVLLTSSLIICLALYHWNAYPFIGGGSHLLSAEQVDNAPRTLDALSSRLASISRSIPRNTQKTVFITTLLPTINVDNLRIKLGLEGLDNLKMSDLDRNQSDLDRPESYLEKIRTSDYVVFPRSSKVSYPSLNHKSNNNFIGQAIATVLDNSRNFTLIETIDSPAIEGQIQLYRNLRR